MYRFGDSLSEIDEPSNTALARALNPADQGAVVVAWPGRRIAVPLQIGDIVVRQPLSGPARHFVLAREVASNGEVEAEAIDVSAAMFGQPANVRLLLHGPDRMLRDDLTIVRASAQAGEANYVETPPLPVSSRPTIRQGSRGPAVNEAQQRMNAIDARRSARGESRIDRCPLVVDGIFGPNTRGATVSFQRLAFPAQPNEWDGIIGPKTWAMLDAWSYEQPVDPPNWIPPDNPPPIIPPIIPIADVALDPPRWKGILEPRLSSHAKLRAGNAVFPMIDGRGTFEKMVSDINSTKGEKDYIYLLGWDMTEDFDMIPVDRSQGIFPNACPTTGKQTKQKLNIINLLARAAKDKVQVRVMLWAKPPLTGTVAVTRINLQKIGVAIRDDETANKTPASTKRLWAALIAARVAPELIPIIIQLIRPDLIRMTGAHHQKVLIIKSGKRLIAYCGGIDINANRLYEIETGDPQHDTHCRIVGPSAWDLLDTFVRRWNHHPDGAKIENDPGDKIEKLRGASEPVPDPVTGFERFDSITTTTCSVIIARTFNPVHNLARFKPERDIQRLLHTAIAAADRFIYIEDQYLFDYPDPKHPKNLDIATALNAAIRNKSLHITILIPGNKISLPEVSGHYRKNFIATLFSGLTDAQAARVGVFQLSHSQEAPSFGCHDYVHSKCWVFDDELAVIGSANCNRRGYLHDSEVNAFIFSDPAAPSVALAARQASEQTIMPFSSFAQAFRVMLWREHLGATRSDVENGVTSARLWRKASRPPTARVIDFDPNIFDSRLTNAQAEALREFVDPVP
jgi:phosphatidylserine/phosphatidylglycerophosphate/cardiolipin synthase-like enzyme